MPESSVPAQVSGSAQFLSGGGRESRSDPKPVERTAQGTPLWQEAREGVRIILTSTRRWLTTAVLPLINLFGAGLYAVEGVLAASLLRRLGRVASVDLLGSIALLPIGLLLVGRGVTASGVTPSILRCGGAAVVLAARALTTQAVRELD